MPSRSLRFLTLDHNKGNGTCDNMATMTVNGRTRTRTSTLR